jgi:hypothetical protein
LPDGIFSDQKSQFGQSLEFLAMKDVGNWQFRLLYGQLVLWSFGIFSSYLVYVHILWSFGKFCGHLENFVVIWNILWSFGIHNLWSFRIFCGHFGIFSRFGMLYQEKSGNPAPVHSVFCCQTFPNHCRVHAALLLAQRFKYPNPSSVKT